jgi:hypothetical protein
MAAPEVAPVGIAATAWPPCPARMGIWDIRKTLKEGVDE